MAKVNSTAISKVNRINRGKTLVTFHHGGQYIVECPRKVHKELRRSRSVGVFYNQHIKGKFTTHKVIGWHRGGAATLERV